MLLRMITKEFQVYAKVVAPSRVPHSQLAKRDDSLFLIGGITNTYFDLLWLVKIVFDTYI